MRRAHWSSRFSRRQHGVTLIELIFVIAIIATLTSISLPALATFIHGAQAQSARSSLATSLGRARTSAIATQTHVAVCPSNDHLRCETNALWQNGWIVYRDDNANGKHDTSEPVLDIGAATPDVSISSDRAYTRFRADGSATGTNLTYTLCDRRGPTRAVTLVINNGGRVREGTPTAAQANAACAALQ